MEAIQSVASDALVNLAIGVITLLAAYAMYGINKLIAKAKAQTEQIEDETSRQLLTDALSDVENLVAVTVGAIEQTTAKALREAVKAGTANREELTALADAAFAEIKAAIVPEAQAVITENLGSFDAYLTKLIENTVRQVKQEDAVLVVE
ncbi:MAG: hypothetical protein LUG13_08420 [Oscillospiraceae bacterium]|nr:hypothetical protein [Oscillospiraceae bacterium]